jgi:hypothetical protein
MRILGAVVVLVGCVFLCAWVEGGEHGKPEKWYQDGWCMGHGGVEEVTFRNGTRCDCLTGEYAVEVEFGPKWAEAIGQSLNYAVESGKKPGIVLILGPGEERYAERIKAVVEKYHLPERVWIEKK